MFRCLTLESVSETPKPKPWVQDQTKFTAKGDVDCSRSHLGCDCFQKVWPNGSAARWATCDNTSARIGCLLWNPTRLFSPGTRTSTISISPTQYKYPCPVFLVREMQAHTDRYTRHPHHLTTSRIRNSSCGATVSMQEALLLSMEPNAPTNSTVRISHRAVDHQLRSQALQKRNVHR